jgi:hypothetical protein
LLDILFARFCFLVGIAILGGTIIILLFSPRASAMANVAQASAYDTFFYLRLAIVFLEFACIVAGLLCLIRIVCFTPTFARPLNPFIKVED